MSYLKTIITFLELIKSRRMILYIWKWGSSTYIFASPTHMVSFLCLVFQITQWLAWGWACSYILSGHVKESETPRKWQLYETSCSRFILLFYTSSKWTCPWVWYRPPLCGSNPRILGFEILYIGWFQPGLHSFHLIWISAVLTPSSEMTYVT